MVEPAWPPTIVARERFVKPAVGGRLDAQPAGVHGRPAVPVAGQRRAAPRVRLSTSADFLSNHGGKTAEIVPAMPSTVYGITQ